jgi:transglutaminase-like putative cysteine protease
MRQLVRRYKKALPIRQLAFAIIDRVRGHKNFSAQVRAIHSYVQENIQFVKDVNGVETLATPTKTLEYGKGDCDDQAVLLASLLESIGHPTRFVAIRMKPFGPYVHVFTETKIGARWIPLETTEPWPAGVGPPRFAARMVVNN